MADHSGLTSHRPSPPTVLGGAKRCPFPTDEIEIEHERLKAATARKIAEVSKAVREHEASGRSLATGASLRLKLAEFHELEAAGEAHVQKLMAAHGITEEMLQKLEGARRAPMEERLLRAEMSEVEPSAWLDETIPGALEEVLRSVPPRWLAEQRMIGGGLDATYRTDPLCVVASRRLVAPDVPGPQRFARMLLAARDHLDRSPDFDFWDGSMLVPELAALGAAMKLLPQLGPVALQKLASLPALSDRLVASTIYELLVGTACLRAGIDVELVEEHRQAKTADMKLKDFPVPARIEVKRKVGLSEYERREAAVMLALLRRTTSATDAPFRCDLEFVLPPDQLDLESIATSLLAVLASDSTCTADAPWGRIVVRRLGRVTSIPRTRLYSPQHLERVFGWAQDQTTFDGLVARVDPPRQVLVDSAWSPQCIAWRNMIQPVPPAKARGLLALLADAVRQIPTGEMGFIYLAYEEGARSEIADARTRQVLEELHTFHHEWGRVIGGCLIHRLYPRPLHEGRPDLIENVVYGGPEEAKYVLRDFPAHIFSPA